MLFLQDAVVPWTRIIPESPEAHLSELVTEPDDSMHSTFSGKAVQAQSHCSNHVHVL